jgi:hypothetical protein
MNMASMTVSNDLISWIIFSEFRQFVASCAVEQISKKNISITCTDDSH